jgi:rhodanese-related sulfurtransferase
MRRTTSLALTAGTLLVLIGAGALWAEARSDDSGAFVVAADASLTVSELKALLDQKQPIHLYDANGRDTYLAGHLPGARWVEYDAFEASVLPSSKDARLVFYCWNPQCSASHIAAKRARQLGYRNAWRLPAGIVGWRAARLPVVVGPDPLRE